MYFFPWYILLVNTVQQLFHSAILTDKTNTEFCSLQWAIRISYFRRGIVTSTVNLFLVYLCVFHEKYHNGNRHSYFCNHKGFNLLLRNCSLSFNSEKGDSVSFAALHFGVSHRCGSQVTEAYNTSNNISN